MKTRQNKNEHDGIHHWKDSPCPTCIKIGKTQALKDFIDLLERRIEELNSLYKNDKENEKIVKIVTNELQRIIKSQLSNKKVGEE